MHIRSTRWSSISRMTSMLPPKYSLFIDFLFESRIVTDYTDYADYVEFRKFNLIYEYLSYFNAKMDAIVIARVAKLIIFHISRSAKTLIIGL